MCGAGRRGVVKGGVGRHGVAWYGVGVAWGLSPLGHRTRRIDAAVAPPMGVEVDEGSDPNRHAAVRRSPSLCCRAL